MTRTLTPPITCLITTGEARAENYPTAKNRILETVSSAVEQGISLIQIREKQLPGRLLFDLASAVSAAMSGFGSKVLINERADVATVAGADGVHLPSNSIPISVLRNKLPDRFLIGASAHSLEEALAARVDGADFVVYGPVFATPEKGKPKGIEDLKDVCDAVGPLPILALGGIDETNFESVLSAGATGFAAIRALNDRESRERILSALKTRSR